MQEVLQYESQGPALYLQYLRFDLSRIINTSTTFHLRSIEYVYEYYTVVEFFEFCAHSNSNVSSNSQINKIYVESN